MGKGKSRSTVPAYGSYVNGYKPKSHKHKSHHKPKSHKPKSHKPHKKKPKQTYDPNSFEEITWGIYS